MRSDESMHLQGFSSPHSAQLNERLLAGASLSGHERDHLFLKDGDEYVEVSGISGLDHEGDSRVFATLDFDRDGWQDIALVSANAPLFQLFRNDMGKRRPGGMVAVRFVGGNDSPYVTDQWSNRDGYGARVSVELGDRTLIHEHHAGEGFAAQNSATMHIGIDEAETADRLVVTWPTGLTYDTTAVPEGMLVTAYENPAASPNGAPFSFTPYRVPATARSRLAETEGAEGPPPSSAASAARAASARTTAAASGPPIRAAQQVVGGSRARVILYTTVATWCVPCLEELPALNLLRETFTTDELEIYGVPYDQEEAPAVLTAWSDQYDPPYRILSELSAEHRGAVIGGALDVLRVEGLPAAVVTDADGEVLLVRWGPPSISEIRVLLEGLTNER